MPHPPSVRRPLLALAAAAAAVSLAPEVANAATSGLRITAPARVAAGTPFALEVSAPGASRIGAFSARIGFDHAAATITPALPLVRGGYPVGIGNGVVGFYGATGGAATKRPVAAIQVEPTRNGIFRFRISGATLYDRSGRVIGSAKASTVTVRVGSSRKVLAGRVPSVHPAAAGRRLAAADIGSVATGNVAGVAANLFGTGEATMARVQQLVARQAARPAHRKLAGTGPKTFVVTTTDDLADVNAGDGVCLTALGTCSLRAAITEANLNNGKNTINFNVTPNSGAYAVFQLPNGPLSLTNSNATTIINGYSQPGSSPNTDPVISNAVNVIYLDSAGRNKDRFTVTGGSNTFQGLSFSNAGEAINVKAGSNNNRIVGDWIGFSPTGGNLAYNSLGEVGVLSLSSTHGNVVGTPAPADRNVFGNTRFGIHTEGYTYSNTIQNNTFGIAPAGGTSMMGCNGTDIDAGGHSNQIGGLGTGQGNHYTGGACQAIELSHGYTGQGSPPGGAERWNNTLNVIQGNVMGLDPYGRYQNGAYLAPGTDDAPGGETSIGWEADCMNVYDHSPSNVIEGNRCMPKNAGFSTAQESNGNVFRSNIIGVDVDGVVRTGYRFAIIMRISAQEDTITGNLIEGADLGVTVMNASSFDNTITGNTFGQIGILPIDIDLGEHVLGQQLPNGEDGSGANLHQSYPVITTFAPNTIAGTGKAGATVEVATQDPTTLLIAPIGTTTVAANGTWALTGLSLAVGTHVYALQTATSHNTSTLPYQGDVAAPATSVTDGFGRTVSAGWGSADVGGPWTVSSGPSFSVNGSAGVISTTAGATREAGLASVSKGDANLAVTLSVPQLPTGSGSTLNAYVALRRNGATAYRARLTVNPAGTVTAAILKSVSGTETTVAAAKTIPGLNLASGGQVSLRFVASGASPTSLAFTVWNVGATEPAPQVTASDSTAGLQGAGDVALRAYASSGVTNGPLTTVWDDLSVQ